MTTPHTLAVERSITMKRLLAALIAVCFALPALADYTDVGITNAQAYPNRKVIRVGEAGFKYAGTAFSMVATPTAVIVIQGSATKTVVVKSIKLSGAATAYGSMPFTVVRRSTAGTLNTAVLTAVSAGKLDTTNGAATAVVSTVGTANYQTLGTTAGILCSGRLNMVALGSAATSAAGNPLVCGGSDFNQPITLRGTSQYLTIEGNGAAIPAGGVLDYEIETYEY